MLDIQCLDYFRQFNDLRWLLNLFYINSVLSKYRIQQVRLEPTTAGWAVHALTTRIRRLAPSLWLWIIFGDLLFLKRVCAGNLFVKLLYDWHLISSLGHLNERWNIIMKATCKMALVLSVEKMIGDDVVVVMVAVFSCHDDF